MGRAAAEAMRHLELAVALPPFQLSGARRQPGCKDCRCRCRSRRRVCARHKVASCFELAGLQKKRLCSSEDPFALQQVLSDNTNQDKMRSMICIFKAGREYMATMESVLNDCFCHLLFLIFNSILLNPKP